MNARSFLTIVCYATALFLCFLAAEQHYTTNIGLVWFISLPLAVTLMIIPCFMYEREIYALEDELEDSELTNDLDEARIFDLELTCQSLRQRICA